MNTEYKTKSCKVKNAKIWQTLILHNCLPLGKQARFTSKNVAQYLLGSRNDYNLFKFNEIKHLLLKFTPLIETLFRSKLVLKTKVGAVRKTRYCKPIAPKDPARYQEWYAKMKNVRIAKHHTMYYYKTVENKRPVKILFASTNPTYTNIIRKSAEICQMTARTNRWLCGYITANSQFLAQKFNANSFKGNSKIERQFEKTFFENKEAKEKRHNWHSLNMLSQRPALAIIPDVANNVMILRETFSKTIPVIGLVNSDESTKISYPIFGNSNSIQIVHFFCNFLAILIAKTFVQQEYKQSSHRIYNKTRAFFNSKNKKTEHTSVNAISKSNSLANTKVFPWATRRSRNWKTPRTMLSHPKSNTCIAIKKSLKNIALFKNQNKRNKIVKTSKNKNQFNKLKYVGQRPYWKNLKAMIYTLNIRYNKRNSRVFLKNNNYAKTTKFKSIETKTNKITNLNVADMYKIKQTSSRLAHANRIEAMLIKKYTAALKELNKEKLISSLKKSLSTNNKKYFKNWGKRSLKIAPINGRIRGRVNVPKNKFSNKRKKWKVCKTNKRKALIKVFGHQDIVRKQKRAATQMGIKLIMRRLRKPSLAINKNPIRIEKQLQKILTLIKNASANVQERNALRNIFKELKAQKFRIDKSHIIRHNQKQAKFFNLTWRNPKLFKAMVKKYPYFTFLAKSLMNDRNPSLAKEGFKILSYELNNIKKNPYAFSLKNLNRKNKISNSILWQNLYFQNWVIKWKKKHFIQKPRILIFYVKDKIKKRGLIGRIKPTNIYYFRRLVHLSKAKTFPKFITTVKKSFRTTQRKVDLKKLPTVTYFNWKIRRFKFKFRRSHQLIHRLAKKFMPWRKNYRNKYKARKTSKRSFYKANSISKNYRNKHRYSLNKSAKHTNKKGFHPNKGVFTPKGHYHNKGAIVKNAKVQTKEIKARKK